MRTRWWSVEAGLVVALSASMLGCGVEESNGDSRTDRRFGHEGLRDHAVGDDADEDWDDCAGAGGAGGIDGPDSQPALDPSRTVQEADIVQMVGNRLYALSRASGLHLIDVLADGQLDHVSEVPLAGVPMEMYVDDGIVVALIDDGSAEGRTIVHVFDTTLGSPITSLGERVIDGHFSDSRRRGDVIYVVSHELSADAGNPSGDESSWTHITSVDVGTGYPSLADELSLAQDAGADQGWRRTVMTTETRMYVAGVEAEPGEPSHSTVQVIDITDPLGAMVPGAVVEVDGLLQSRWQLDEHAGVLRVISQPGGLVGETPTVQTFSVLSSQELQPLGSLDLTLPVPESLRSVRFDGSRAYAITAEVFEPYDPTPGSEAEPEPPVDSCGPACDPLIVIDLADPSQPEQLGSLEMPGWVFFMVPRGDQLLALGFEATYPLGPLSVSLFDVSDGDQPTMVERVTFGGEWTGLSEDQNRIHKSFNVVDELGLVLVPYGWWDWESDILCEGDDWGECGGGEWCWDEGDWARRGAVQLVDFDPSGLTLRGSAPLDSWALRSLVHDDRLLAVSDEEVRNFDIGDRDLPVEVGGLGL